MDGLVLIQLLYAHYPFCLFWYSLLIQAPRCSAFWRQLGALLRNQNEKSILLLIEHLHRCMSINTLYSMTWTRAVARCFSPCVHPKLFPTATSRCSPTLVGFLERIGPWKAFQADCAFHTKRYDWNWLDTLFGSQGQPQVDGLHTKYIVYSLSLSLALFLHSDDCIYVCNIYIYINYMFILWLQDTWY